MNKLPFQGIAYGRVGGLAVQLGRTDVIGTRIQTPREEVGVHFIRFRVMNERLLSLLTKKKKKKKRKIRQKFFGRGKGFALTSPPTPMEGEGAADGVRPADAEDEI